MKKIIDYYICRHEYICDLSTKVSELIADGWQPYGVPSMELPRNETDSFHHYQPMVKYED